VEATLYEALKLGNPVLLADTSETRVITSALDQIQSYETDQQQIQSGIYNSSAIRYTPSNSSQLINITENEAVFPLLTGNNGNILAAYGQAGRARFAAFGSTPMGYFVNGVNLNYEAPFKRVLGWLTSGQSGDISTLSQPQKIALTFTGSSNTKITQWLNQNAAQWQTKVCNDPVSITTCYQGQDLLILSWENNGQSASNDWKVLAAVKAHLKLGKPILYLHTWYWNTSNFSTILGNLLGFNLPYGGNYWAYEKADYADLTAMQNAIPSTFSTIKRLLLHFKHNDFNFDWSLCTNDTTCKSEPLLTSDFYQAAESIKSQIAVWEAKNLNIFSGNGRRLNKLLVLLGDKFRSGIAYPMQVGITDTTTFMKALYADHSAYIVRQFNPEQPDLGSYSPSLTDVKGSNATLQVVSKTAAVSSTTGFYALPGKSITLTRTDKTSVKAYVHINMLRSESAHVFAKYDRPMFLWSKKIPLIRDRSVTLTSPYGGIMFINTEGTTNPLRVLVNAANVVRTPIFFGKNFADFTNALVSSQLNWAEFKFQGLEIHSRMDLMQQSINDPLIAGNLSRLLNLTQIFLYKDIYSLAGMVGTDLTQPYKVKNFCTAHDWDCDSTQIHGMPSIQHVNADRAACGYGCSGNPYDQYWAFTPLGWGESHEIGHNLQRSRLKIYDSASTEVSNNIFPTHKWLRFNKSTTETVKYGRSLGFKDTYDLLQQGAQSTNPTETVRNLLWLNGSVFQRLIFYWQMAMSSKSVAHLGDNGWDIFRLMYIHERLFSKAIADDTAWLNNKDRLGFNQYVSRSSVTGIAGNDFMLISMSFISGRDQRPFFDMWGVTYSIEASNQVKNFNYPKAEQKYWVVPNEKAAFKEPLATPLPVDGQTVWPY
jgi:hypothetical protein